MKPKHTAENRLKIQLSDEQRARIDDETLQYLHELQVHQTKLEMQNEELLASHAKIEEKLARYTDLYDFAPVGHLTLDRNGLIIQTNQAGARLLDFDVAQLRGHRFGAFVSKTDLVTFNTFLLRIFETMVKETCIVNLIREDQPPLIAQVEATLSSDGQECHITLVDITASKQVEEELLKSENKFQAVFENSVDAIGVSERGVHVLVNPAYLTLFGYSHSKELIGKPILDLIAPEQHEQIIQNVRNRATGEVAPDFYETRGLRKDGTQFDMDIQVSTYQSGDVMLTLVILRDISRRKQTELHEIAQGQTLTALVTGVPLAEVLTTLVRGVEAEYPDMMGSVLLIDTTGSHLLTGAAPSLPAFYNAAIHGVTIGPTVGSCGTAAFTGKRVVVTDIQTDPLWSDYKALAAQAGLAACWSEPILSSNGRLLGTFAFYYAQPRVPSKAEIDTIAASAQLAALAIERKQAEVALATEKELLSVTLLSIGDGVITTDTNGNIVLLNKAAEELTGWNSAEAAGHPFSKVFNIIDERSRQKRENPVEKVLATGEIVELENHTILVTKDEREIVITYGGAPIHNSKNQIIGVVLVFKDMTEKQKLDSSMQRTQKLESIGVLAGGIAHDFNNLLSSIFGHIELAYRETTEDRVSTLLIDALTNIDRARALTQQLLTFAKGGEPIKKVGDISDFVQKTTRFALSGSSVLSKFQIQENLWPCNFDKNQIAQVIDNLVINAQYAMPNGGMIEVSAENVALDTKEHLPLTIGNYVKISIKDYGAGIPKEFLPRIFDPYYTTKPKGHGLGLSTCYSIINRHGGCIDVESVLGKGSRFDLYLPASTKPIATVAEKSTKEHTGSGTFLVMDDNQAYCDAMEAILESFGYTVVTKENGQDAIDFFVAETQANRKLAGMIFDLTIPGATGGKEAISEIRKISSDTPVFVASGYAADPIMANPEEYGFNASLRKPFDIAELSEMLEIHLKKLE